MTYSGYVDYSDGEVISGWAARIDDDAPIAVDLIIGETLVGTTLASAYRADLEQAGIGRHAFTYSLPHNLLRDHKGQIRVVISGTQQDLGGSPLTVTLPARSDSMSNHNVAERPNLEHQIAAALGNQVTGWLYDPDQPDERLYLQIVVDRRGGQPLDIIRVRAADRVNVPGRGPIPCGFTVRLPVEGWVAKVSAYEESTGTLLEGSPLHLSCAPRLEGWVDGISNGRVTGWAWGSQLDYAAAVDVLIDGAFSGTAFAVDHRGDLQGAGVGSGHCGFTYDIPDMLIDGRQHAVEVRFHGTDTPLAGSPARAVLDSPARATGSHYIGNATIGSDGLIHGVLTTAADINLDQIDIEIEQDGKLITALRPYPSQDAPAFPENRPLVEFRVAAPPGANNLTFKVRGEKARFPIQRLEIPLSPIELGCATTAAREAQLRQEIANSTVHGQKVKMLVAIWGGAYIERFCQVGIPSLLADNNLPHLQSVFNDFEFAILTRSEDIQVIKKYSAFVELSQRFKTKFVLIDDIIDTYFKRSSAIYAVALTYAFLRGMHDSGADAKRTNFVFWNADFMASDGTFLTLAKSITAGNACTMAPSLRLNANVIDEIIAFQDEKTSKLAISPQDLVRIALKNPHPTVEAKTINADKINTMNNINQFYWKIDDDTLIARSFLMFMLHIRPEQLLDNVYSFCDYAFVPDMIIHGNVEYITQSDDAFIAELQEPEKESEFIISGEPDIQQFAYIIDETATIEHISASRHLLVFNAGPPISSEDAKQTAGALKLDRMMSALNRSLRKRRPWHAHHFHWRGSFRVVNPSAPAGLEQGPIPLDYPRCETARMTRWTGYDMDLIEETPLIPPQGLLDLFEQPPALRQSKTGSMERWLDDVFRYYQSSWLLADVTPKDNYDFHLYQPEVSIDGRELRHHFNFYGSHWGLVEQRDGRWWRMLGPAGGSIILQKVTQRTPIVLTLFGRTFGDADVTDLTILINDRIPGERINRIYGDYFRIRFTVPLENIIGSSGRLIIKMLDCGARNDHLRAFGFTEYNSRSLDLDQNICLLDVDSGSNSLSCPNDQWSVEPPALARLREIANGGAPPKVTAIDRTTGMLGAGWRPPFCFENLVHRWIGGQEFILTRVAPGFAYSIQYSFLRSITDAALLVSSTLVVCNNERIAFNAKAEGNSYVLEALCSKAVISQYSGWLTLAVEFQPAFGRHGIVDLNEPTGGGLALSGIVIQAFDDNSDIAPIAPLSDTGGGRLHSSLESFWLRCVMPHLPAPQTLQDLACKILGTDPGTYRRIAQEFGEPVQAAWAMMPPMAAQNWDAASTWLDYVDRAVIQVWADKPSAIGVKPGVTPIGSSALFGLGFGPTCHRDGILALELSATRAALLLLSLESAGDWILTLSFALPGSRTQALRFAVQLSYGTAADQAPSATCIPLVLELPSTSSASWLVGSAVTAIAVERCSGTIERFIRPVRWADGKASHVVLWPVGTSNFMQVAERHGLDPWLMLQLLEKSDSALGRRLVAAFDHVAVTNTSECQMLLNYLEYVIGSEVLPTAMVYHGTDHRHLAAHFIGLGWGAVASMASQTVRVIAPERIGTIITEIAGAGVTKLTIIGAASDMIIDEQSIVVTINDVPLPGKLDRPEPCTWSFETDFEAATPGRLAIGIMARDGTRLAIRELHVTAAIAKEGLRKIRLNQWAPAVSNGMQFPALDTINTLERFIEIPAPDVLLARFGRDPLVYNGLVRRLGDKAQKILASAPTNALPTKRSQAWLDLLDESIVEHIIAEQASQRPWSPVFGESIGLGWGGIIATQDGPARLLSGPGEGLCLIPPEMEASAIEIRFARGTRPEDLAQLRISVNKQEPKRQTLFFSQPIPSIKIEIEPEERVFGQGWLALRLYLGNIDGSEFGAAFRNLPPNFTDSQIAVLNIAVSAVTESSRKQGGNLAAVVRVEAAATPTSIRCVVPVWGDAYIETFLQAALPTHLVDGNLEALRDTPTIYEIYTDALGHAQITAHQLFRVLENNVSEVKFFDVADFRRSSTATVNQLTANYDIMNQAHQKSIAAAAAGGGALLFLNCDTIYSTGVFARVWELSRAGYRSVENLSIRTDRDEMLAALSFYRSSDGLLRLQSSEMTRLALKHLHWIAKGRFWHGPPGLIIPDNLYWQVAEEAILARATHYMPLFVFPKVREVHYRGTIDHGFVPASGINKEEIWRFEADSEPSSWELSLTSHDQHFIPYERGSVRDFARFLGLQCEGVHLHNLEQQVRIAAQPVSEERWNEVSEESKAILVRAAIELQHYCLTPWRPNRSMRAERSPGHAN